jgi:6-phosphogluconolactonase
VANTDSPQLRIQKTAEEAAELCADFIIGRLRERIATAPFATIAISGGSSPRPMFLAMAKANLDWSKVMVFWVDERCVPPDDDRSNYKLAQETLLGPARVPPENVHRILGEIDPEEAAGKYVQAIRDVFKLREHGIPQFDVIHRGMGADAHTASLFPGSEIIRDETGIAAHVYVEKLKMDRVTLLPAVLEAARSTVLLVSGEDKKDALRHVLNGKFDPMRYPCQIASRTSNAIWFLDEPAAALL